MKYFSRRKGSNEPWTAITKKQFNYCNTMRSDIETKAE